MTALEWSAPHQGVARPAGRVEGRAPATTATVARPREHGRPLVRGRVLTYDTGTPAYAISGLLVPYGVELAAPEGDDRWVFSRSTSWVTDGLDVALHVGHRCPVGRVRLWEDDDGLHVEGRTAPGMGRLVGDRRELSAGLELLHRLRRGRRVEHVEARVLEVSLVARGHFSPWTRATVRPVAC